MFTPPDTADTKAPRFDTAYPVSDWRNHITASDRAAWATLTDAQRATLRQDAELLESHDADGE